MLRQESTYRRVPPVGARDQGLMEPGSHLRVTSRRDQPVIEPTDFDDRPKLAVFVEAAPYELGEERHAFLRLGSDLAFPNRVTERILQVDRNLSVVLVNSKVKQILRRVEPKRPLGCHRQLA